MKSVSCNIEIVNKEKAEALLLLNTLTNQISRFRQRRVEIIKELMREGTFRHAEISMAIMDGKEILVNGQHTLHAISQLDNEITSVIERFEVSGMEELALLFMQFDQDWSTRHLNELLGMELHAQDIKWPIRTAALLIGALCLNDRTIHKMTIQQRIGEIKNYIEEGNFLHEIVFKETGFQRYMGRSAVAAAMLRSRDACEESAIPFWRQVRDATNTSVTDPEKYLRDFLWTTKAFHVGSAYDKAATNHEVLYRCAKAWNARRSGRVRGVTSYSWRKPVPAFI